MSQKKKAFFLDRDGVINSALVENNAPKSPKTLVDIKILPGVLEAVTKIKAANYEIVVVTNQPDIARKKITWSQLDEINSHIKKLTSIDHIYVCPHEDLDNCKCRKPKPGLITSAASDFNIELSQSFMVGDRWRDIEAGQQAGCHCYFIDYSYDEKQPDKPYVKVNSLLEAVNKSLGEING